MDAPVAIVTGATSGIGEATAQQLLQAGYRVVACGRNAAKLAELNTAGKEMVHTLAFDVTQEHEVARALASLPAGWQSVNLLVNNAGNAHGLATIQQGLLADWEAMIDSNVKGLLYVTRHVLPLLQRGRAHIINVGSIAAKEVYKNGTVYCASKKAVDALSEGMRKDLLGEGVKVSAIHPGLVNTGFSTVRFKGDRERADAVYAGMTPLSGGDVAQAIVWMAQQPWHINLADVVILPQDQAAATEVHRR